VISMHHNPISGPASPSSIAAGNLVPLETTLPWMTMAGSGDQPAGRYAFCYAPASRGGKNSQNPEEIQQFEKGYFSAALEKHQSQLFRKPRQINDFERHVPRKETKQTMKTTTGVMQIVMHMHP